MASGRTNDLRKAMAELALSLVAVACAFTVLIFPDHGNRGDILRALMTSSMAAAVVIRVHTAWIQNHTSTSPEESASL